MIYFMNQEHVIEYTHLNYGAMGVLRIACVAWVTTNKVYESLDETPMLVG